MSTSPVTLDFSKAQPVSRDVQLDFSKAQPIEQTPPKKYLPGRQFGMDVARGMGLDADKIAAAEDSGGQGEALKEIGGQILEGLKSLAKDPLLPITGTASNFEQAV